jgi:hypothetical protein
VMGCCGCRLVSLGFSVFGGWLVLFCVGLWCLLCYVCLGSVVVWFVLFLCWCLGCCWDECFVWFVWCVVVGCIKNGMCLIVL